jgi:hypothetical protein
MYVSGSILNVHESSNGLTQYDSSFGNVSLGHPTQEVQGHLLTCQGYNYLDVPLEMKNCFKWSHPSWMKRHENINQRHRDRSQRDTIAPMVDHHSEWGRYNPIRISFLDPRKAQICPPAAQSLTQWWYWLGPCLSTLLITRLCTSLTTNSNKIH